MNGALSEPKPLKNSKQNLIPDQLIIIKKLNSGQPNCLVVS